MADQIQVSKVNVYAEISSPADTLTVSKVVMYADLRPAALPRRIVSVSVSTNRHERQS